MLLALGLAAPFLLIGVLSDGQFADRVLQGGFVMLGLGSLAAIWMWRQGSQLDREQDEREHLVVGRSATFTALITAIMIHTYWAWKFAAEGNAGDDFFWVLAVFWAAFAGSYFYNRLRS
jgi:hypothetical protein